MRVIGVTGGVGAGKSTVLGILEKEFQAYVIQADQLGHILMEPGEECYDAVIALFGKEIIKKDKTIDRRRISDVVFTDKDMLLKTQTHISLPWKYNYRSSDIFRRLPLRYISRYTETGFRLQHREAH